MTQKSMRRLAVADFHALLKSQGVSTREHSAVKCPVCGTVQSIALLIDQGCPTDKVETQIGFSCVGRWNGAGPATYRKGTPAVGKLGCDWTLGGFIQVHTLEVEMDGKWHPVFEPASPDEAVSLERHLIAKVAPMEAAA